MITLATGTWDLAEAATRRPPDLPMVWDLAINNIQPTLTLLGTPRVVGYPRGTFSR